MSSWLRRPLPMTARLSLVVAVLVLATAALTTQLAVRSFTHKVELQFDRFGQIYLDGLAAALLPSVIRGDIPGINEALAEALRMHQGLLDQRLILLSPDGVIKARADRAGLAAAPLPEAIGETPRGVLLDRVNDSFWVWRPLADLRLVEPAVANLTIAANLDVGDYAQERSQLRWRLVAFNVLLGVACAVSALLLMRHILRPVTLLTRHLQQSGESGSSPVRAADIPDRAGETTQLLLAYNRMARAMQERELLLARMAEQEREAVLGRLAATLAHEVRNPLAGVLTAIETLRKFGDQPSVRAGALDFMERGIRALTTVVDATLSTYRPPGGSHTFGPLDVQDLHRLAEAQARRAGVALVIESTLAQPVPVAGHEVRQVLLNLLLNAVKASSPGGQVTLRCALQLGLLRLEVLDQGDGLPGELVRDLEAGSEPTGVAGLGVAVVIRLVQQLQGRVAVQATPGRGTHIVLELPLPATPPQEERS